MPTRKEAHKMSDNKYLPIKIFEKRKDYDDRRTEGGGNSKEPSYGIGVLLYKCKLKFESFM